MTRFTVGLVVDKVIITHLFFSFRNESINRQQIQANHPIVLEPSSLHRHYSTEYLTESPSETVMPLEVRKLVEASSLIIPKESIELVDLIGKGKLMNRNTHRRSKGNQEGLTKWFMCLCENFLPNL